MLKECRVNLREVNREPWMERGTGRGRYLCDKAVIANCSQQRAASEC